MSRHHAESGGRRMKWAVIGLTILALFVAVSFLRETVRARQVDRQIAALEDEADRLRIKNFEIRSLSAAAQKQEFIEREARTKMNLQKAGERVVVIRKHDLSAPPVLAEPKEIWTNPKKWWMYFADHSAFEAYDRTP